jgi:cohesin loading factor subunit SCC2
LNADLVEINSNLLAHIVDFESPGSGKARPKASQSGFRHPTLAVISSALTLAMPHLTSLLTRSDISFSDTLIIQAVYLAIGPFFVDEPVQRKKAKDVVLGRSVMKTLRVEALGCLRGVSRKQLRAG